MAPHRRFGGSSVAEIFIFLISNKNCPLFVKEIFFYLGRPKSYEPAQFFAESVSSFFFWHQFKFFCLSESLGLYGGRPQYKGPGDYIARYEKTWTFFDPVRQAIMQDAGASTSLHPDSGKDWSYVLYDGSIFCVEI